MDNIVGYLVSVVLTILISVAPIHTLAMFNGVDSKSPPTQHPIEFICPACSGILEEACQTQCGCRYHPKCAENLILQTIPCPRCEGDLIEITLPRDRAIERTIKNYLGKVAAREQAKMTMEIMKVDEQVFSPGVESKEKKLTGHTCIWCEYGCDEDTETYSADDQSYYHTACLVEAFEYQKKVKANSTKSEVSDYCLTPEQSREEQATGGEASAPGYTVISSSQLITQPDDGDGDRDREFTLSIPLTASTRSTSIFRTNSFSLNRRKVFHFKQGLEKAYGSFRPLPLEWRLLHMYNPEVLLSGDIVSGVKHLLNRYPEIPGYDFPDGQVSELRRVTRAETRKLKSGEYLVLFTLSDRDVHDEGANFIVISRKKNESDWVVGDVTNKLASDEYCLMVASPEKSGEKCLQCFTRPEVEQVVFTALFYALSFGREHSVLLTPFSSSVGNKILILDILGSRQIEADRPSPVFLTIRNILKMVALASGFQPYAFHDHGLGILSPLKKWLQAKRENREAGDMPGLDVVIQDTLSSQGAERPLETDDQVLQEIKLLSDRKGGVLKLFLRATGDGYEDDCSYYLFLESGTYYLFSPTYEVLSVFSTRDSKAVESLIRFILLGFQPQERQVTHF
ncbi:hypothetical protein M3P05_16735 [Sansalvadorimonas sp. 2012CJ34-2]|uniref:RING-type domain-containing protein n=1 Tax=Parendozoicomonas callyspongiae TaxID=2942213 RepID=A0ABT0PJJ7_9GAMM|nr:hypothetical protein [Sansalvadorimonas sp. 2012CJ34-2]MCL6271564.1 hypothetical protein [Sansalvadorimonas sp. 2012CJ34-2]